jgi:photosystem II stability/assembly factor-like uncharacterized protein
MKTTVLTLALLFFPFSPISAQWEILNEGFACHTIDFANENIGWIAGDKGTLVKTTDGGENWNDISINENFHIGTIDFFNESFGLAFVKNSDLNWEGEVWKTSDGGANWIQQFSNLEFSSLYILNENNVYAIGGDTIFKTTNGGTDWIDVSPNLPDRNYNSVWFQDSQTGVVVGSYNDGTADRGIVLKTSNGGNNWIETIVYEFNSIYDLQFFDNTNGYFRAYLDTTNFICKTEDMLASWIIKTQHPYSITSYQYLDNDNAYAIMGDSITGNNIMKSVDGGINWNNLNPLLLPPSGSYNVFGLREIYFLNMTEGFLIGNGCFYKSIDGGQTWKILSTFYPFMDASFFNNDRGLIIGGWMGSHGGMRGNIFSLINNGETLILKNNSSIEFNSCAIIKDSIACVTGYGVIYKTTDYGNIWAIKYQHYPDSGYRFWGNDITFINNGVGWSVGMFEQGEFGAAILYTQDCGENWNLQWRDSSGNNAERLNSINFSESIGFAVGDIGRIIKYTPQTGWVKQTSVTNLPLNKVFFSDDNHGWISGGYQNENDFQKILLKTTNGGATWTTVPNIPYLFRDIAFMDNNLGWAIGYTQIGTGGILKTIDGGDTWSIDTGNLPAKLNALHIKDNYGWAVGDNGLILRTTDAGAVWVEDESNNSLPTEFVLEQNYPNPFNPSTKISWQSPVGSRQTIKIFDVLGSEIITLVDEYRQAGAYETEFTAGTLPSGIYFYQLRAVGFVDTKKMILLK